MREFYVSLYLFYLMIRSIDAVNNIEEDFIRLKALESEYLLICILCVHWTKSTSSLLVTELWQTHNILKMPRNNCFMIYNAEESYRLIQLSQPLLLHSQGLPFSLLLSLTAFCVASECATVWETHHDFYWFVFLFLFPRITRPSQWRGGNVQQQLEDDEDEAKLNNEWISNRMLEGNGAYRLQVLFWIGCLI